MIYLRSQTLPCQFRAETSAHGTQLHVICADLHFASMKLPYTVNVTSPKYLLCVCLFPGSLLLLMQLLCITFKHEQLALFSGSAQPDTKYYIFFWRGALQFMMCL